MPCDALRRILAHLDPEDPSRPAGRRPGTTRSPYACDFEVDEEALAADIREVREFFLDSRVPGGTMPT